MSNQGGVKNAATEPTRLENKRERRRGAAGRAAALRRAPSDSDCSGETASLSADSGDRAVRPAPQPPPRGKSRSRRRGSEWEVLEGLKDGQRFDKRPEVFNGYLHKKRKWPLKGWHKRFFVVDGGILVYARSPADVARGRLHGSVDVGLSVISAKARRRRIDIDADEFIYHLRAKTPDVFRTWLSVLKAHRLYRQHLLTFGARESVPKIHAPLEDLPPTDTSSPSSSVEISTLNSLDKIQNATLPLTYIPPTAAIKIPSESRSSPHDNKNPFTLNDWPCTNRSSRLLPLKFDDLSDHILDPKLPGLDDKYEAIINETENFKNDNDMGRKSPNLSLNTTDAEKQMHSTDLELSLRSPGLESPELCEYYINATNSKDVPKKIVKELQKLSDSFEPDVQNYSDKETLSLRNKTEPLATYCFSTYNVPHKIDQSPMRRSKKSTNLVKYKNLSSEPPLKKPFNTYKLLGSHSNKANKDNLTINKKLDQSAFCNIVAQKNIQIQAEIDNIIKPIEENTVTTSDLDRITEKLMMTIFENIEKSTTNDNVNVKNCINQVVKELYDSKISHNDTHPVIALFKCLLEYWLKNTSVESVREAVRKVKSIDRQSNKHFTKDQNTSSLCIGNINKHTQFHGISDVINQDISRILVGIMNKKGTSTRSRSPQIKDSCEKERRIQELERILKNTVYICETARSKSIEKDIKITKTLIDNLEKMSQKTVHKSSDDTANLDNSNSSSELPKIQDTINRLISETSLPLDVAKDFLNAYLDLLHDSISSNSSSESTENSKDDSVPECDVQTESIQKKASVGITTKEYIEGDVKHDKQDIDPGQLYLKSIIDNITAIFCNGNKEEKKNKRKEKETENHETNYAMDELGELTHKKSMVINLSNYNLEQVSMLSNPNVKEITSITMKLKEKFLNPKETKSRHLRLKFSSNSKALNEKQCDWDPLSLSITNSNQYFPGKTDEAIKSPVNDLDVCKNFDLKPYQTSSDATSKDYRLVNSDHSLNAGFQNNAFRNLSDSTRSLNEENDPQSCYIFSSLKKCPFQGKKKNQGNDAIERKDNLAATTSNDYTDEITMFERTPKVIDDRFILLLLENLTLLSKNAPAVHKDINALYLRLRKKYDKVLKNDPHANGQGVGLLGKIYNAENNNKTVTDNQTQFERCICCDCHEISTKISEISLNKCDKAVTTNSIVTQKHMDIQTEQCNCIYCLEGKAESSKNDSSKEYITSTTQTETFSSMSDRDLTSLTAEKAISNQNWYRKICTKECGVSTLLHCVLDNNTSSQQFRIKPRHVENRLTLKLDKELTASKDVKIENDPTKEITLLLPCYKVSTQSQTDQKIYMETDFNVYELYQSKSLKRSSSMIESNREMSDDLKTLYRCTSDPSYCSG